MNYPDRLISACQYQIPVALVACLFLIGCDMSDDDANCLTVTPNESFVISGTAATTNFTPASKTYVLRNTCDMDVTVSVEEDVRWLDVEIDAFEPEEFGVVNASTSINVEIEVRYGSDNPERLDQLAAGTYTADLRFVGESDAGRVDRTVQLTVNAP